MKTNRKLIFCKLQCLFRHHITVEYILDNYVKNFGTWLFFSSIRIKFQVRYLSTAVPLAFLAEKAGGKATDGRISILKAKKSSRSRNTSLIFGSLGEVNDYTMKVEPYNTKKFFFEHDTENDDTSTDLN